jgi:hypothetical protein
MGDVCLMYAVLVGDAFEAKLGRRLTSEERQDLHDAASRSVLGSVERGLERTEDADAAAVLLAGVKDIGR